MKPLATASAVIFAKDARRVATFYYEVFGLKVHGSDAHHSVLECNGFEILIQQIPEDLAKDIVISTPPHRRETGAIRLDFPVRDVAQARRRARQLGGKIDDEPPPWAGGDPSYFLGFDPEGNVFCAKVSD